MIRFHIPAMTCGGCASSVTRALLNVDPQARIQTDPAGGKCSSRVRCTAMPSAPRWTKPVFLRPSRIKRRVRHSAAVR